MLTLTRFGLAMILAVFIFSSCSSEAENEVVKEEVEYFCPMHCEGDKVYDKPGDCPVCGMELSERTVKVENLDMTSPES